MYGLQIPTRHLDGHKLNQNPGPHTFEGIFESQNMVLVAGLQLDYG